MGGSGLLMHRTHTLHQGVADGGKTKASTTLMHPHSGLRPLDTSSAVLIANIIDAPPPPPPAVCAHLQMS